MAGIGASLGLVVGGALTDLISWRAGFLLNVPIGLVLMVAAVSTCPRPHAARAASTSSAPSPPPSVSADASSASSIPLPRNGPIR
jgi:MFS family permease